VESLPESQRNVFNYDAQIVKLKEEIERNRNFKMKLYENLQDGMIGQEEYFLFKKSYESKIQSAEAAITAVEQERQQTIEHNRENYAWIDVFKKYQNITSIERKAVVELLEEIIVHEDKKIRLRFRYGDQYTKLVELLENYSGTAAE
jgi:ribosomal protein L11 methylase PrmA